MKRLLILVLHPFWRLTQSIRRPLVARFDDRVARLVASTVNARMLPELLGPLAVALRRLERIEESLAHADQTASALAEEVDLVFTGVSREIFRLQAQLERLQTSLTHDARAVEAGLSIIDHAGDTAPVVRGTLTERSKVG